MTRDMRCLEGESGLRERERGGGDAAASLGLPPRYQFYRNLICDSVALGRSSKFKSHEFVDGDEKIALFPARQAVPSEYNTIAAAIFDSSRGGLAAVVCGTLEEPSLFRREESRRTRVPAPPAAQLKRVDDSRGRSREGARKAASGGRDPVDRSRAGTAPGHHPNVELSARVDPGRRRFPLREATGRRRAGTRNLNRTRREREREREMIRYPAASGGFACALTRSFHAYARL